MPITRTLNPLPFEHLEPKRFEDLVRQLVYDFRTWRMLEATGRSGADEGFDARAIEIAPSSASAENESDVEMDDLDVATERMWLIQCKREKEIGPSKVVQHLEAIPVESINGLYGVVFAAACDFSKATRDACRGWCRKRGIQEVHVWGRGEIEDQLFQPKNDNLLFAYFGISLQIRRQSAATEIRRRITLKRRIRKMQENEIWPGAPIILRDPSDERYPQIDQRGWRRGDYPWLPVWSKGAGVDGLRVIVRQHYAYFDHETGEWDFATGHNQIYPHEAEELWPSPDALERPAATIDAWSGMPRRYQMHFRLIGTVPYEEIIEIDQEPDDFCKLPTVFTTFRRNDRARLEPPIKKEVSVQLEGSQWNVTWHADRHVLAFPDDMRDLEWEEQWLSRNGIVRGTKRVVLPVDAAMLEMRKGIRGGGDGASQ